MDAFLCIIASQEHLSEMLHSEKSTALPEISGKGARKKFLVKNKNKMLLETLMILHM